MQEFQAQNVLCGITEWIREWFKNCGGTKAVIGISGGKDSSVTAALCARALGRENVYGIMMPNGIQSDIEDSKKLCKILGINSYTVNIQNAFSGILSEMPKEFEINTNFRTNTPCRLRMTFLYAIAACIPESRVANTGNYDEAYCGYTTIYGDFAGDFAPLKNLHVSEVQALGNLLNLPYDLVHKTPSDGMCGKTDEENLGFTYLQVEKYSHNQACYKLNCKNGNNNPLEIENAKQIQAKHISNEFKQKLINIPSPIEKIKNYLPPRE
ncbi:MAG: NAD(+) synthase [Treponemataceae bacterium]